jgi:hypothetical protein
VCARLGVNQNPSFHLSFPEKDEAFATAVKYMSKEESLYNVRSFALLNYEASVTTFID